MVECDFGLERSRRALARIQPHLRHRLRRQPLAQRNDERDCGHQGHRRRGAAHSAGRPHLAGRLFRDRPARVPWNDLWHLGFDEPRRLGIPARRRANELGPGGVRSGGFRASTPLLPILSVGSGDARPQALRPAHPIPAARGGRCRKAFGLHGSEPVRRRLRVAHTSLAAADALELRKFPCRRSVRKFKRHRVRRVRVELVPRREAHRLLGCERRFPLGRDAAAAIKQKCRQVKTYIYRVFEISASCSRRR